MRYKEIVKILQKDGWYKKGSRGSHNYFIHSLKSGKITVPNHSGDIAPIIVKLIFQEAGLNNYKKLR